MTMMMSVSVVQVQVQVYLPLAVIPTFYLMMTAVWPRCYVQMRSASGSSSLKIIRIDGQLLIESDRYSSDVDEPPSGQVII